MAATRILVVEDEFLIALDIAGVLEQAGLAVIGPASTVGDALQAIAHEEVHGALLDAQLLRPQPLGLQLAPLLLDAHRIIGARLLAGPLLGARRLALVGAAGLGLDAPLVVLDLAVADVTAVVVVDAHVRHHTRPGATLVYKMNVTP